MSSLSGALDESALKPTKLDPALEDVEMHLESHHPASESEDGGDTEEQDEEMADLFGNDDEEASKPDRSAAASPTASGPESDRLPTPERERRQALEYEEEDENPPDTGEVVKEADVSFPNLPIPKSSDGNNWVIRMPNFVKMDTKPFHPDTYLGPEEEESMQAESVREKSMTIKLKVENTVRWRWIKDASGRDQRQSNSRIIRWSDGTMSLLLGKELFDITQSIDTSAGIPRQATGLSASQSQSQLSQSQTSGPKSQGLTYLVAQHKRSQVLQSEAVVTGYMSLRPTGMQSETHRMLVRAVGQKHSKVARLRLAPDPTMDPERDLKELLKQSTKKSRRKADTDDLGGGRRRRQSRRAAGAGALWSSDEDAGGEYDNYDEEDEDGMDLSTRKGKRKDTKERTKVGEDYQEDDFLVADSSDEEGVSKKKNIKNASDVEEDPLDRLDAQIEEQDTKNQKKPRKPDNASNETDEDGMDVESEEEDEDDFKVRRVGGSGRKRGHITMDDEEE